MGEVSANLRRMVQFAEVFPTPKLSRRCCHKLGWTQFTLLIPSGTRRDFYAKMCRIEGSMQAGSPEDRRDVLRSMPDGARTSLTTGTMTFEHDMTRWTR
jgi:hypothetical protein